MPSNIYESTNGNCVRDHRYLWHTFVVDSMSMANCRDARRDRTRTRMRRAFREKGCRARRASGRRTSSTIPHQCQHCRYLPKCYRRGSDDRLAHILGDKGFWTIKLGVSCASGTQHYPGRTTQDVGSIVLRNVSPVVSVPSRFRPQSFPGAVCRSGAVSPIVLSWSCFPNRFPNRFCVIMRESWYRGSARAFWRGQTRWLRSMLLPLQASEGNALHQACVASGRGFHSVSMR